MLPEVSCGANSLECRSLCESLVFKLRSLLTILSTFIEK